MGVAVLAVCVTTAACGTRASNTDKQASASGRGGETAVTATGEVAASDPGSVAAADPVAGAANPGAGAGTGRGAAAGAPPAASAARPGSAAAPAVRGEPIRIGVVGTHTGIGSGQYGTVVAVQAWAKAINAAGGINGHPVEVITRDDGADASRFKAILRELVEEKKVVAFVGALSGFTMTKGAVDYLEQKRVPMVGGDRVHSLWNESEMLFPQASAGTAAALIHAHLTVSKGGRGVPVGVIACAEAQQCRDSLQVMPPYIDKIGGRTVYTASVSVFAPDYTPQCVQARDAGATHLLLGLDVNSVERFAKACHDQGYRPVFETPQTAAAMATNSRLQGLLFASATFPFASAATPAMQEFQRAMQTFAPRLPLSGHASSGWVAAKLFEKAAARVPAGGAPTSASILEGLWSVREDTLGGLTAPLTFVREQSAPPVQCYFSMSVERRTWVAHTTVPHCEPFNA